MAPCPDENVMLALVARKLPESTAESLRRHIEVCRPCQLTAAEAVRELAVRPVKPLPDAEHEIAPGALLCERYRLERVVGRGGVGTVWAARRLSDEAEVAIKLLRQSEPALIRRVLREAKLSRHVPHAAFVPVHEVLELAADRPALVMDLLRGEPLSTLLDTRAALELGEVVALLTPIAEALVSLHGQAIAHRDLKPANVFLEQAAAAPRVRILDLGMARSYDHALATVNAAPLTEEGSVMGTPRYMAPEQLDGSGRANVQADVWALGAMAYRMFSGQSHVEAWRFVEVVRALHTRAIPQLSQLAPHLPAPLAELTQRSLALEPEERPSAADWLRALQR